MRILTGLALLILALMSPIPASATTETTEDSSVIAEKIMGSQGCGQELIKNPNIQAYQLAGFHIKKLVITIDREKGWDVLRVPSIDSKDYEGSFSVTLVNDSGEEVGPIKFDKCVVKTDYK
ncbi:MAG: hypothetical protein V1495_09490 [Pseudomonadota bacterium]